MAQQTGGLPALGSISAGNPGLGIPSGLGEALLAIGNQFTPQAQMKRLTDQAAAYTAAAPLRQALLQQINNNPALAHDRNMEQRLRQIYANTGVNAPVGPQGIDTTSLGGTSFQDYVKNNLPQIMEIPQENRVAVAHASGVQMTPQDEQLLTDPNGIPYQFSASQQVKLHDALMKGFQTTFNNAQKTGDTASALSAIRSAVGQATAEHWSQADIEGTFGPYLAQSLDVPPSVLAKIHQENASAGANDALANTRRTLLDSQLAINNKKAAELDAKAHQLIASAESLTMLTGPKAAALNAAAKASLARAGLDLAKMNENLPDSEWYKANLGVLRAKGDYKSLFDGYRALSTTVNSRTQAIASFYKSLTAVHTNLLNAAPDQKAQLKAQASKLEAEILQLQQENHNDNDAKSIMLDAARSAVGGQSLPHTEQGVTSGSNALQSIQTREINSGHIPPTIDATNPPEDFVPDPAQHVFWDPSGTHAWNDTTGKLIK